ncbi:MAG: hypothetical protein AOA65_0857 [Candidatus Bathyarchaeota archaeon BA1]|nr:MAG: hypothetical protein AOA65_0857 [Candidatus Bathyarchaeota archaeon BA1]
MPHKTITISLEAYEALLREKVGKESFTDVILKLTAKKRTSPLNCAGKWAGDPKELDKALSELNEMWAFWSKRVLK